jgi:hypothetical protein
MHLPLVRIMEVQKYRNPLNVTDTIAINAELE